MEALPHVLQDLQNLIQSQLGELSDRVTSIEEGRSQAEEKEAQFSRDDNSDRKDISDLEKQISELTARKQALVIAMEKRSKSRAENVRELERVKTQLTGPTFNRDKRKVEFYKEVRSYLDPCLSIITGVVLPAQKVISICDWIADKFRAQDEGEKIRDKLDKIASIKSIALTGGSSKVMKSPAQETVDADSSEPMFSLSQVQAMLNLVHKNQVEGTPPPAPSMAPRSSLVGPPSHTVGSSSSSSSSAKRGLSFKPAFGSVLPLQPPSKQQHLSGSSADPAEASRITYGASERVPSSHWHGIHQPLVVGTMREVSKDYIKGTKLGGTGSIKTKYMMVCMGLGTDLYDNISKSDPTKFLRHLELGFPPEKQSKTHRLVLEKIKRELSSPALVHKKIYVWVLVLPGKIDDGKTTAYHRVIGEDLETSESFTIGTDKKEEKPKVKDEDDDEDSSVEAEADNSNKDDEDLLRPSPLRKGTKDGNATTQTNPPLTPSVAKVEGKGRRIVTDDDDDDAKVGDRPLS